MMSQHRSNVSLISYALIKLNNTGLYGKPIKRWNDRTVQDRQRWSVFRPALVAEYEQRLREGGGMTMGQDGYGTTFMASMPAGDKGGDGLLIDSVIQYAEQTAVVEVKTTAMDKAASHN